MQRPIFLLRCRDNQLVEASLCSAEQRHRDDFKQHWRSQLRQAREVDQDWDWAFKERVYGSSPGSEMYAIECDGMAQGLMLIDRLGHRSWFEPNQRILYVRALATAPWNRPSIQTPPRYKTVGGKLLNFARERSAELGYRGIVGLHSLPEAEGFYRRMGLIDLGPDADQENLVYFEWYRRAKPPEEPSP